VLLVAADHSPVTFQEHFWCCAIAWAFDRKYQAQRPAVSACWDAWWNGGSAIGHSSLTAVL